eukprot:10557686-Alexandrium_andersonii.AAC.1
MRRHPVDPDDGAGGAAGPQPHVGRAPEEGAGEASLQGQVDDDHDPTVRPHRHRDDGLGGRLRLR